jgi:2-oxoglutarate dehydrogenase E1 component
MRQPRGKPLVLFTPKSLLRFPASFSPLDELTRGSVRTVLDDPEVSDRTAVSRVLLCSGKIYYDLRSAREQGKEIRAAIVRVEQLYPFPADALRDAIAGYRRAREVVWVQEEAQNMGAWTFIRPRRAEFLPGGVSLWYAGRAPSASPATGSAAVHKREIEELIAEAFG